MKPISINDTNYSLHNTDNFKKTLDYNSNEILSKYSDLLTEYLKFFFEKDSTSDCNVAGDNGQDILGQVYDAHFNIIDKWHSYS